MANRHDARHEEFWKGDSHRTHEWNERSEHDRPRDIQQNIPADRRGSEPYGVGRRGSWSGSERHTGYGRSGEYEWEPQSGYRQRRDYDQERAEYGNRFSERPYSASSSYIGEGGYPAQRDLYHEDTERGYGATGTGAEWGSVDTGRHRLGSLTASAAASAQRSLAPRSERRYEMDYPERISYAGRGPKGYKRADERIREDVCELLMRSEHVDASNIEVSVHDGTVVLSGTVDDRHSKRMAEDISQDVSGVQDVQNQIRIDAGTPTTTGGVQVNQGSRNVLGLSPESTKR